MSLECISLSNNSIEVFSENKSTFRLLNEAKRSLIKSRVDGCLIKDGIKCDFLVVDEDTKSEIYIELKGGDVEHAVNQIKRTVGELSKGAKKKWGYIICTKCPLSTTQVQLETKKIAKSHGVTLRIRKTVHEARIEELI